MFVSTRNACPHLPMPKKKMSWRDLNQYRETGGINLYVTALHYAQQLWLTEHTARTILALDRAIYTDLRDDTYILEKYPMPYKALAWILKNDPQDSFLGNPRVSYQHLAGRIRGDRALIRRWRSWACWSLVRDYRPELPGDPRHIIKEPNDAKIAENLEKYGYPDEVSMWKAAKKEA